jgi:hypothetical protein
LATAAALSNAVKDLALASIQQAYPVASLREQRWHLASRLYGVEVANRWFA